MKHVIPFAFLLTVAGLLQWVQAPRHNPVPSSMTPNSVLASVWFDGCSGTVVSKGEKVARIISCGHCFEHSAPGTQIRFYRADGKTANARLERCDPKLELSELVCNASDVLAVCPVPESLGETTTEDVANKSFTICGYPGGVGPTLHRLSRPLVGEAEGKPRWTFRHSDGGRAAGGSSGCGIFADDLLVGVESHIDTMDNGATAYATPYPILVSFIRTSRRKDCGDGLCPTPSKWQPKPNVPVVVNGETGPDAYGGKGKAPDDLDSCRKLAAALDLLRKRVDLLERQVAAAHLNPTPGETLPPPPVTVPPPAPSGPDVQTQIDAINRRLASLGSGGSADSGKPGPPGPAGTVTVNFIDAASGKILQSAKNVPSGSVVNLRKTRTPIATASK